MELPKKKLDPEFITGLVDGEWCFHIRVRRNSKIKVGWSVETLFIIGFNKKDLYLLILLKDYFNWLPCIGYAGRLCRSAMSVQPSQAKGEEIGNISVSKDSIRYTVGSIKELSNVIIPAPQRDFLKFPLITQKKADFILLSKVIDIFTQKDHLIMEGLHKIKNLDLKDILKFKSIKSKGSSETSTQEV